MPLSVADIFGKKKLKKFLNNDIQYATLVSMYQNLNTKKLELIQNDKTSFLDVLVDCGLPEPAKSTKSEHVRNGIYKALIQKIRVGLIALGKIHLSKISAEILHLGPNFASEDLLRRVCCSNSEYFTIKQSEQGPVVQIASVRNKKKVAEDATKPSISNTPNERAQRLLKHFYKTRPDLVAALDSDVPFKDILNAYNFWEKHVSYKDTGDFIDWLLLLAKVKSPENFTEYEKNLNGHLAERIVKFVQPCPRTIAQILENLCIDRNRFLTLESIQNVVRANQKEMFIVSNSRKLSLGQQVVQLTQSGANFIGDLDLPERLEARLLPLLTLRLTYDSMLNSFRIVYLDPNFREVVEKYGCFLNYLVEYGKEHKPKLSTEEFTQHLYSFVKPFLLSATSKQRRRSEQSCVIDSIQESVPAGLLNESFIRDAAQFYSTDFAITPGNDIIVFERPGCSSEPSPPGDDSDSPRQEDNPVADLESTRILHLLTKQPEFAEVLDVFSTLSEASVSVLANNSMSFFEWMITLSKRLMPHDAPIFEAHLQNIIRQEVSILHSKQRCQMTVQHVHCLLCANRPMLLSPNFLSWCLEQPGSPFCVFQSWVYVKNATRRRSSESSTEPSTSRQSQSKQKADYSLDNLLCAVRDCVKLSDLLGAIKAVPLEQVGFILQNSSYWYDFLENNVRERKDREILSYLLADEARLCLDGKILRMCDLVLMVSKGVANLVSADTLEYALRHDRDTFALAGAGKENCRVGTVRQIEGNEILFANNQEETLMRQVLLYFPSSGSSEVSTILCVIRKEDSFLHKGDDSVDADFLRCFFQMFPMLFYLRGDTVVLTCMALDKKGVYKNAFYPTSTTGADCGETKSSHGNDSARSSPRKRTRSHSRRHSSSTSKRKRRRHSSRGRHSSSERDEEVGQDTSAEVIVIEESSEEETSQSNARAPDGLDNKLVMDENDDENGVLRGVIDNLPGELVADITTSLLMKNDGKYPATPLLDELLFVATGVDESQQIRASEKLFSIFKKKIFVILNKGESKFNLVSRSVDSNDFVEVQMAKVKEESTEKSESTPLMTVKKCEIKEPQVEEISSTSVSPGRPRTPPTPQPASPDADGNRNCEVSTPLSVDDDVIKLPSSPAYCAPSSEPKDEEKEIEVTSGEGEKTEHSSLNKVVEKFSPLPTYSPSPEKPVPVTPSYSTSSACNAYAKEAPIIQGDKGKHDSKTHRERQFMEYFKSYLKVNAGTCATELLISSAYRRFQSERFARSPLAFEAYIYDFAVKRHNNFVLSGTSSEFGVSKVFYNRGSPNTSPQGCEPANLNFLKLENDVCAASRAYLHTVPHKRTSIGDLCDAMEHTFPDRFNGFAECEIGGVVRCLVLVSLIRNLASFCFAVHEPVIYLRQQKRPEESSPPHPHRAAIDSVRKQPIVKDAVLLMAKIIESSRPGSQTALRTLWQAQAPSRLAKVFGTGISFTLALRKYSFLFPTSAEGTVTVDEHAMTLVRGSG